MSEFRSTPHSTLRNLCSLRHFCANKQKEAEADGTRCLKSNNKSNEIRPPPKISHSTLLYIPCKALTGVGFAARHRKCVHSFSTSDFLRPPPLHHLANSFCHLPLPGQVLRTPLYIILPPPRPSAPDTSLHHLAPSPAKYSGQLAGRGSHADVRPPGLALKRRPGKSSCGDSQRKKNAQTFPLPHHGRSKQPFSAQGRKCRKCSGGTTPGGGGPSADKGA